MKAYMVANEELNELAKVEKLASRIYEIDIVKALAIILMVVGHSGAPHTGFIYLFHMSAFFIASGFVYKSSSSDSLKEIVKTVIRRVKQLWVPFFVWNAVFTLLNNAFLLLNIYTDDPAVLNYVSEEYIVFHHVMSTKEMLVNIIKGFLFAGSTDMGGAFWFLRVLFVISVLYCVLDYGIKLLFGEKYCFPMQAAVAVILLVLSYYLNTRGVTFFSINYITMFYYAYFVGHLLDIFKDRLMIRGVLKQLAVFAGSFILLLGLYWIKRRASYSVTVFPLFLLVSALSGWCLLFSCASLLSYTALKKAMVYVGKNTLPIMILHFLAFKAVAALIVRVYRLPHFCVAAFPNLYGEKGLWWMLYSLVGMVLPLICYEVYLCVKKRILTRL